MSQTNKSQTITLAETDESSTELVPVEKKSIPTRVRTFASKHKKPLIAAGLLGGLVAGAAWGGRKTAPSIATAAPEDDTIEIIEFDGGFTVLDTSTQS
jgi:hypothetical protein